MTRDRQAGDSTGTTEGESFLRRFSRRKYEARLGVLDEQEGAGSMEVKAPSVSELPEQPEIDPPGDDDMPPLESLTADSDYSAFFSPKVSESLRQDALRRLWQIGDFGVCDGLDIYAADYTRFEALGDLVTAEMKHRIELEMRRQAEALAEAAGEGEPGEVSAGSAEDKTAIAGADEPAGCQVQPFDTGCEDEVEEDV